MMDLPSIIAMIALWLILAGLWCYFAFRGVIGYLRGIDRSPRATVMAQISALTAAFALLVNAPFLLLAATPFPPLLLIYLPAALPFLGFLWLPLGLAALGFALVFGGIHRTGIAPISLFAAGLAALLTLLAAGEVTSHRIQCLQATEQGLSGVTRASFLYSLRTYDRARTDRVHALASDGQTRFGWSYAERRWYQIPDDVFVTLPAGRAACATD